MNKKAQVHPLIIIAAIVIILIITGVITLPSLFEKKYKYLTEVEIFPKNVSSHHNVEISLSILNPHDYTFQAELFIEFKESLWTTDNYYIKRGEPVNLGKISPKEIKKYSIKLTPTYNFNKEPVASKIKISLFDSNNKLIEKREEIINA